MPQLYVGDIVQYQGGLWIVEFVNSARARIRPESKRKVKIENQGEKSNETVEFEGGHRSVSISPVSDIPVVGRVEA